jgi:hypothetical protein
MDGQSAGQVDSSSSGLQPSDSNSTLHELTDRHSVEEVIKSCLRTKPLLEVIASGRRCSGRILARKREQQDAVLEVVFATDHAFVDEACSLRFELYGVLFVLTGRVHSIEESVAACTPLRLFCLDRRVVARQRLAPGRAELVWSWSEAGELHVASGAVRDLSPGGVGVISDDEHAPIPNTTFAATIRVGDQMIPCLAKTQRLAAGAGQTVGVTLWPASGANTLNQAYLNERHPRLVPRRFVDQLELRALMEESGYLALRSQGSKFAAWHQYQPAGILSCDMVYRAADGKILGHVSATQIYRRTWLWHQLASLPGHAESGESRLHLYAMGASVPTVYHGRGVRALAYFNPKRRWHQVFFQSFVSWLNDPSAVTICYFDRFERELAPEPFEAPGCEVRSASSASELMRIAALVRSQLDETVADAFDIHPGELQHLTVERGNRGREVLTLYENGEIVGAGLCDLGDPNLSLFNLFNMGQIYLRAGRRAPSPVAQRVLVSKMRQLYAQRGVEHPLLVAPANTLDHAVEPGTRCVESMGCLVITDLGLRQFENFCRFHFGRRWRRNASAKQQETVHE